MKKITKKVKSPYKNFTFVKKLTGIKSDRAEKGVFKFYKFHDSFQKIFKAKKNYDLKELDKVIPEVLDDSKVKGVLVVFEVTDVETDTSVMVSNYITAELLKNIRKNEETVDEYVAKKLQASDSKTKDLKFIYMRIIYFK